MTVNDMIRKINESGHMLMIGPDGEEAQISQAAMNNEYLTLSIQNEPRRKVMIDTTALVDITDDDGAYHISTADKGLYTLTAKRLTAEGLVAWVRRGRTFLIDTEFLHLSFNKLQTAYAKDDQIIITLQRDPVFPDLKTDGYDAFNITLSREDEIAVLNDYTAKFSGVQLTILNY